MPRRTVENCSKLWNDILYGNCTFIILKTMLRTGRSSRSIKDRLHRSYSSAKDNFLAAYRAVVAASNV